MTVLEPVVGHLLTLKIGKKFTTSWVQLCVDRPRKPVLKVLRMLAAEGYLEVVGPEASDRVVNRKYRLLKYPLESRGKNSPTKRTNRDRVWKAIRDKRKFTCKEIAMITGINRRNFYGFVKLLEDNGYLKVVSVYGREKTYVLLSKKASVQRPIISEMKKKQGGKNVS